MPNFPKSKHFLPPDTHIYACVWGGKKCLFFGKFDVLCFLETPVLIFALWPYYRRIIFCFCQETISQSMTMKSIISTCKWTRCLWLVFWFVIRTLAVYGNSYLCNSMGLSNTWLLEFQYPIPYFLILLVNTHQNKLVYQNK